MQKQQQQSAMMIGGGGERDEAAAFAAYVNHGASTRRVTEGLINIQDPFNQSMTCDGLVYFPLSLPLSPISLR